MQEQGKEFYEFGPFRLDPSESLLLCDGQPIPLTPKLFELLLVLVENAGNLVDKGALLRRVWPDSSVEEGNITKNIHLLRGILEQGGACAGYIETVPKRGYRLRSAVRKGVTRPPSAGPAAVVPIAQTKNDVWVEPSPRGGPLPSPAVRPALSAKVEVDYMAPKPQRRWFVRAAPTLATVALALAYLLRPTLGPPRVVRLVQVTHLGNVELDSKVIVDGERLYFIRRQGGRWQLAQVSIHGGQAAAIPTPFPNTALFDISPNHAELLVGSFVPNQFGESTLWALPLPSGSPRSLGKTPASLAVWSPDGTQVYYCHRSELAVVDRNGMNPRKFLNLPNAMPWTPAWDPKVRILRFTVTDLTTFADSIWQAASTGTELHRVLPNSTGSVDGQQACCGVWTPDGRYFIFKTWPSGPNISIQAISETGRFFRKPLRKPVQLYSSATLGFWHLSPSQDARTVFFPGIEEHWESLRFDGRLHQFVPFLAGTPARTVRFSRDGKWMLWLALDSTIWRSRADGSDPLQLTFSPAVAQGPRWSPEADKILFTGWLSGGKGALLLVPRDGGAPEAVLTEDYATEPGWSPGGQSVVFVRRLPTDGFGGAPRICVLDLESGTITELPNSIGLAHPTWSPDGRYVAAVTTDDRRLMVFDYKKRLWAELVSTNSANLPVWSHDGKYVYFQNLLNAAENPIFRVRVADRKMETVATSQALRRADFTSYRFIGLAPDDSPLVLLDRSSTDIYALDVDLP